MNSTEICLRNLEHKDIEGMLEWMHDPNVNRFFRFDAESMTVEKAEEFVKNSLKEREEKMGYHFAIADNQDQYLGTISLKNIDWNAGAAEYAISLRSSAQGKGVATAATKEIFEFAFKTLHLNRVFLNVLSENKRAIRFYEKYGFVFEGEFRDHLFIRGLARNLRWYSILKNEYYALFETEENSNP